MNTSTPKTPLILLPNNIRKFTPIRRSTCSANTSLVTLEKHNDEDERQKRRSMVAMHKQLANAPSRPSVSVPPSIPEHEIKQHIDTCIKLYAENKITLKNAWSLKVIDYIRDTLFSKNPLQMGSTSLDVGTKVYSIRVDDIHSDGLKLASNMARIGPRDNDANNDDDIDDVNSTTKNEPAKKKRKRLMKKCTVAKDDSSFFGSFAKIESAFFQTQSDSSLSLVDNLFTTRLPTDHSGCRLVLLNKNRAWPMDTDEDPTVESDKTFPFHCEATDKFEMCPEYVNFKVDVWDPLNDDIDESRSEMGHSLIFDDKGIPVAELDGSIHDIFNVPDPLDCPSSAEEDENYANAGVPGGGANICDYDPANITTENEFSYHSFLQSNNLLSRIAAGPSHWKLKYLRRASSRFSGAAEEKVRQIRRCGKKAEYIDFYLLNQTYVEKSEPYTSKKTIKFSKDVKYGGSSDYLTTLKNFNALQSKPARLIEKNKQKAVTTQPAECIGPYNYENANDSLYCARNNMDDGDNVDHHNDSDERIGTDSQNHQGGDDFINIPDIAPKTQIKYATHAKKMDMKKLKAVIWKILTDDSANIQISDEMYKKKVQKTTFREVYAKLPQLLNESMASELSCSLAFIAILHLANEQNLQFTSDAYMENFIISQVSS